MNMDVSRIMQRVLVIFFLLLGSAESYALPFSIVPKAGTPLPTTIHVGRLAAYYTVTNNNPTERDNNYVKYLPPNVSQVTSGGTYSDTCGTTFNLAQRGQAGDSCTLQLSISGAVDSKDTDPHHHLFVCFPGGRSCAGTDYPLNVAQPATTFAYFVADGVPLGIFYCPVNANGTFGTCSETSSGYTFTVPFGITLNSVNTYAYIPDYGTNNVVSCPINSNGSLGACTYTNGFEFPTAIVVNSAGTLAYVLNSTNNELYYCNINSNGTISHTCSAPVTGFTNNLAMAINPAGSYLYAISTTNVCYAAINSDGSVGVCNDAGATDLVAAEGIAINPAGTYAYMANAGGSGPYENTVIYCTIQSNGSFGACKVAGSFESPLAIAFNATGTLAYVTNTQYSPNGFISLCPVNSDGSFGTCSNAATGLPYLRGIAVS